MTEPLGDRKAAHPGLTNRYDAAGGDAQVVRNLARSVCDSWGGTFVETDGQARLLLLDSLGCAMGARGHPVLAKVAAAAAVLGEGPVRSLATGRRRSLAGAALENGAAIRLLDLNDFYWGPGLGAHPSDMFGPALALAEAHGASLGALIRAVAIGYEVYLRMVDQMASDGPFDHATAHTLGTAAIASLLRGAGEDEVAHALAMAAATAPSLLAVRHGSISEFKGVATAQAAVGGLVCAELAHAALTGPVERMGHPGGLATVLREGSTALANLAWSGAPRRMLDVVVKRYPCIGTAQAAVAAAAALHARIGGRVSAIAEITMRLADSPIVHHQTGTDYRRPDNRETADHSFFSLVAMALADGDLTLEQFERGRFRDTDVLALGDLISFRCDLPGAEKGQFGAELRAQLQSGEIISLEVPYAPGHPRNPLSRTAIADKFRPLAGRTLSASHVEAIVSLVLDGELDVPANRLLDLCLSQHSSPQPSGMNP